MAPKQNPLPLSDTLRDLALLRASDLDFASLLAESEPASTPSSNTTPENPVTNDVRDSVQRSYEFVSEARAALKILNRNEVDKEGLRVDEVRGRLEEVLQGLEGAQEE